MTPEVLKKTRRVLGMTQQTLAERLHTTRTSVARYECGERKIPGMVEVAIAQLTFPTRIPMASLVAAGEVLSTSARFG